MTVSVPAITLYAFLCNAYAKTLLSRLFYFILLFFFNCNLTRERYYQGLCTKSNMRTSVTRRNSSDHSILEIPPQEIDHLNIVIG